MSILLDFPLKVLKPIDPQIALVYNTRPGHEATNGMRRSLGYSGAQFKLRFSFMVHDTATARAARAFFWNMEGDSQLVRISMPDRYGIDGPYAIATRSTWGAYPNGIPFATDALYATGVGHAVPTLSVEFAEAAESTDRYIYVDSAEELPAGCAISIDEFCYGVAGSWLEEGVNRLKLSPGLRKAALAGDEISLAPIFVGTCITDAPGYESMRAGLHGTHEVEFIEDLTRLVDGVD